MDLTSIIQSEIAKCMGNMAGTSGSRVVQKADINMISEDKRCGWFI